MWRTWALTVQADGVTDPDGAVTRVVFYLDSNANGLLDAGDQGAVLFDDGAKVFHVVVVDIRARQYGLAAEVHRRLRREPIINSSENKSLCAAPRFARHGDLLRVYIGQRLHKIDSPHRIPELQAQRPERPQLLTRPAEGVGRLDSVVVPDHVIGKDHVSLPREADGPCRNRAQRLILQPSVGPVTMRRQHARQSSSFADWPVQIAAEIVARQRLQ